MQSFGWYTRRLRSMSPAEIAWRLHAEARELVDRIRIPLGMVPALRIGLPPRERGWEPGFRVTDLAAGAWRDATESSVEGGWRERLVRRADRIAAGHLSFFDLEDVHLGDPIDWSREHGCGRNAPMAFSGSIDYRDHRVTGDCKLVWEPNRHHQMVVLARATRATGDDRFGKRMLDQVASWLDANPFGYGMNWRSPLELAIRLINWVWAIDLVRDQVAIDDRLAERLLRGVYLHAWEIERKYSKGSSANNHSIGEAAGVFVATAYFPNLPDAARWNREARAILEREILEQTFPDGGGREQAFGYHLFTLQFFLAAAYAGRRSGREFSPAYRDRLGRMAGFLSAMREGGPPDYYGDADDGYVLDLGDGPPGCEDLLSAVGAVVEGIDLPWFPESPREFSRWLSRNVSGKSGPRATPVPRAFPDSGLYLLQSNAPDFGGPVSVLFDCGDLGFRSIAAHGHADALAFTLRWGGLPVLVDPGTFDYFTYPEWRTHFRSTRAHNTVEIDGVDQSVMQGPFLWGERAVARALSWRPEGGGEVVGEHDGYLRLPDPVAHERAIRLDETTATLVIRDRFRATGSHKATWRFHFSPACRVTIDGDATCRIETGEARYLEMRLPPGIRWRVASGGEHPIEGWFSAGYHRKVQSPVLEGQGEFTGTAVTEFVIAFDRK